MNGITDEQKKEACTITLLKIILESPFELREVVDIKILFNLTDYGMEKVIHRALSENRSLDDIAYNVELACKLGAR